MGFGYTGREFDEETGQYYYRARYYDAPVGRFISEDPIGFEAGDANVYRYVLNSPTNFTDPSGLLTIYKGNPIVDTASTVMNGSPLVQLGKLFNPQLEQQVTDAVRQIPGVNHLDLNLRVNAGEGYAEEAQRYYVDRINNHNANTPWDQKAADWTGGILSSLWTCDTSDTTAAVLGTAWGVAKPAANTTVAGLKSGAKNFWQGLKGSGGLDDVEGILGSNKKGLSPAVQEYWDEYYRATGSQGDDLQSLINSAERRGIRISPAKESAYDPTTREIELSPNAKKWEFFEEFLHKKADEGWKKDEISALTKQLRKVKDYTGRKKSVSAPATAAEEIIVKEWLLRHGKLVGVQEPEKVLLQNQINQLRNYGTGRGY